MLQMVRQISLLTVAIMAAYGCSSLDVKGIIMPTSDGVETRFENCVKMNSDLAAGTVDAGDSYLFYVAADPHITETHASLDIFNDTFRNDEEAAFGVVLGDCSDIRDNLKNYIAALSYYPERHSCNHRMFHILGNHDLFFDGWGNFKEIVGPSIYWFEVNFQEGKDLYISLDTATGTLGRKQTKWLKSFLAKNRNSYRHCIILTHTNFFYTDTTQASSGNMPMEECFALLDLFDNHDVTLVLQGHDHYREDLTYGGVQYTVLGAISDAVDSPEYLKVKVNADGVSFDWQVNPTVR